MGNSSALGTFARKAIAWLIVIAAAILLFKFVIVALAGFIQLVFGLVLLALVAWAVLWALKRL
ncbi:MAG TPA: hypothetical protein VNS09_22160 [Solirubrobacter sp.]|nr:hypothetical protein [Solirubrobacter sp.]